MAFMEKLCAVIKTGGKQYIVSPGETLKIEKMPGKPLLGNKIIFDKVLLLTNSGSRAVIGSPYIKDAEVKAVLEKEGLGTKIDVIHYKPKVRYFKKNGHRQPFWMVKITDIKQT